MDERTECERLFQAAAPYVIAEQAAEEAFAKAALDLRIAKKEAATVRREWVEFLLAHDHRTTCARRQADDARGGEE